MRSLACLILIWPLAGHGDALTFYRCTDGQDKLSYSVDPCPKGSQQAQLVDSAPAKPEAVVPTGIYRPIRLQRQRDGHFYATLTINDVPIQGVIDTGASFVALAPSALEKVNVNAKKGGVAAKAETANGTVDTTIFTIPKLNLYDGIYYNVLAGTMGSDLRKTDALIGMSLLSRFNIRIDAYTMTLEPK